MLQVVYYNPAWYTAGMKRQTGRRHRSEELRTAYVTARISEQSRHYLEVLALLHHRSLSSIIEAGIDRLVGTDVRLLGSFVPTGFDEETRCPVGTNYAVDTWAPEEWLRRFKMSLIEPRTFLSPAEEQFWMAISKQRDLYWLPGNPEDLPDDARRRLGDYVLGIGIPNESAIQKAWEDFKNNDGEYQGPSTRNLSRGADKPDSPAKFVD